MARKLSHFFERLRSNNQFAYNVSVLAGGSAVAQAIVVIASPLLARLYTPADFGVLAVFGGLLGILGTIAALRYQLAIPLPESEREAAHVAVLSLLIVLGMTALTAVIVLPFRVSIAEFLNVQALVEYMWLLPLGLLFIGVYEVLNYWAIRTKSFTAITRGRLVQSAGMVTVQILGYSIGPLALLLGRVLGQLMAVMTLGSSAFRTHSEAFPVRVNWRSLGACAYTYRGFPLFSTWTGLASAAAQHIPAVMIAATLGISAAGVYALTDRVLSLPMSVIGKAVGDVFYREAISAHRENKLGELVASVHSKLTAVALPVAVVIFLSAPKLFKVVFGENWEEAGNIASWMVPWLFFRFITTPPTRVYPILDRHRSALVFQVSLLLSTLVSITLGAMVFESILVTVALLSGTNSLIYLFRLVVTYRIVGESSYGPLIVLARCSPLALACGAPLIVFDYLPGNVGQNFALWSVAFLVSVGLMIFVALWQYRRV